MIMNLIARELEYVQEGLVALQRSVKRSENEDTQFIIDNLLTGTARLIEMCKEHRKHTAVTPEDERTPARIP